jgi:hypothetical protein
MHHNCLLQFQNGNRHWGQTLRYMYLSTHWASFRMFVQNYIMVKICFLAYNKISLKSKEHFSNVKCTSNMCCCFFSVSSSSPFTQLYFYIDTELTICYETNKSLPNDSSSKYSIQTPQVLIHNSDADSICLCF